MTPHQVAVIGGNGKTGVAVCAELRRRGVFAVPLGRHASGDLAAALSGSGAAYLIAPNMHPDEPRYIAHALGAVRAAGITRIGYHSVAAPYTPQMPHHLGKAVAEDLVRRSGLRWTILQPGPYVENIDLTRTVLLPYRPDAVFGFVYLDDVARAVAQTLLGPGHEGATYELASRQATVADLAAEAGVHVEEVGPQEWLTRTGELTDSRVREWLLAMFAYYDTHGLPAGVLPLRALLAETEND